MTSAEPVVLDASALIASIYEEAGAGRVERHLANGIISAVNLSEVASYMVRRGTASDEVVLLLQ